MKLREQIRPPKRLAGELLEKVVLSSPLRRSGNPPQHDFVDFNPHLPPAAFPTLDRPRACLNANGKQISHTGTPLPNFALLNDQETGNDSSPNVSSKEKEVDFDECSINSYGNYITSNGSQNPVYRRNIVMMARCDDDEAILSLSDTDVEESCSGSGDSDEDSYRAPQIGPSLQMEPEWSDLTPPLQVEIIDNLRERYSWPTVSQILGLTAAQREEMRKNIRELNSQIALENGQLKIMRTKQIRRLLRIDNSRRPANSDQLKLDFEAISTQQTSILNERLQRDYLLCRKSEVLNARRFLKRRGLDTSYVGLWDNSILNPQKRDTNEFCRHRDGFSETDGASSSANPVENTVTHVDKILKTAHTQLTSPSLRSKQLFINEVGLAVGVGLLSDSDSRGAQRNSQQGKLFKSRRNYQSRPDHEVLQLKIGTHRAAMIRDTQEQLCVDPKVLTLDRPDASAFSGPQNYPQASTRTTGLAEPIKRTMGGSWSYWSLEHAPNVVRTQSSSSARVRKRLKVSGSDTEGQDVAEDLNNEINKQATIMVPAPNEKIHATRDGTYSAHDARFALERASSHGFAGRRRPRSFPTTLQPSTEGADSPWKTHTPKAVGAQGVSDDTSGGVPVQPRPHRKNSTLHEFIHRGNEKQAYA